MLASLALSVSKQRKDVAGDAGHCFGRKEEADLRTWLFLARAQSLPASLKAGYEQIVLGQEDRRKHEAGCAHSAQVA